jgi:hypothetical protein
MTDDGPYPVGQRVKTTVTFADYSGTPTDPTTITFKYENPAGTVTTIIYPAAGVTKIGTGVFSAEVTFDTAGSWWRRWNGTGTIVAAFEAPWFVTPTRF